jgi:hypothetical protein
MSPLNRKLTDLEEALDSLYDTLGDARKRFSYANDIFERNSIKQRVQKEVLPDIRKAELEYWQLLAQEIPTWTLDEAAASNAIAEVIQTTQVITQNTTNQYPDQAIQLLTEILNKLNEPGKSSSAKLKATIPLLPPFVSYELEFETQGILQRLFPTFSRLLSKTEKK